MSDPIRVMLADDHAVVRAGIRQFLEHTPDIQVIAEADDGEMAPAGHFGLPDIWERAESIGAKFAIDSTPEAGTRLTITLPVPVQEQPPHPT